ILKNQWFITYGDEKWKVKSRNHLKKMTIYPPEARQAFEYTIDWLQDKACARKSGLGTPLPWDPEWIVETLSDSTVYMAYYTIARIINEKQITAQELTNEVFDYIFRNKATLEEALKTTSLSKPTIEEMKEEFEYFYPPDFRASAKELIFNHLTFYIFQHLALFPKDHYPLEIEGNGMIMIEGGKMSKSGGNSITLKELLDKYGADASRFGLAYCGEGYPDASFRLADSEAAGKRMKWLYSELTETVFTDNERRIDQWIRSKLQSKIQETHNHYDNLRTRSAITSGFFDILNDMKWYETRTGKEKGPGYKEALLTLVDLMTPIIPHFAEEINEKVRKESKIFASYREFPKVDKKKINLQLEQEEILVKSVREDIDGILSAIKKQEKNKPSKIEIFIAPDWMYKILKIRRSQPANLIKEIMEHDEIKQNSKIAVKYAQKLMANPGIDSTLSSKSEYNAISDAIDYYKREYKVKEVKVYYAAKSSNTKANVAEPARPGISIEFE
ncbi:MAG: class I tRNA ligase family protein, partial [Candidatus Thorarchaeota archaeon]